jgi:hypothetical protein
VIMLALKARAEFGNDHVDGRPQDEWVQQCEDDREEGA